MVTLPFAPTFFPPAILKTSHKPSLPFPCGSYFVHMFVQREFTSDLLGRLVLLDGQVVLQNCLPSWINFRRLTVDLGSVQTDSTLLANNSQYCCVLHVASVCTPCCMFLGVAARIYCGRGLTCSPGLRNRLLRRTNFRRLKSSKNLFVLFSYPTICRLCMLLGVVARIYCELGLTCSSGRRNRLLRRTNFRRLSRLEFARPLSSSGDFSLQRICSSSGVKMAITFS